MKFYHFYDPAYGWARCTSAHRVSFSKEPHPSGIMSERTMKGRRGCRRYFYNANDNIVYIYLNIVRELQLAPI